jgi:hypothetical protein
MSSPNGACAGSASITTSMSRTYSVPYRFARSEVEVRLTGRTVEIFVRGERLPCTCGERQRQAHHIGRSYAVQSSPLRRLDYRPYPQRCRPHWAGNHCSVRVHSGAQAASRAGLPILPRPSSPHTTASASMPPPLSGWLRDFLRKASGLNACATANARASGESAP